MALPATVKSLRAIFGEIVQAAREQRRHQPDPPPRGAVLEIGGGQGPHLRADVVLDKYVGDSFERPRESAMSFSKPLVVGDGHHLPFKDQSFAYVIALHVLEHASDPSQFAAEMARVAPAGFVQVPSRASEQAFGWPYHPWLIDQRGEMLVFEPRGDLVSVAGPLLHQGFAESASFRLWFGAHRSRWHHSVHWRSMLSVQTTGDSAAPQTAEFDLQATLGALNEARTQPLPPAIRARLCCPVCRGDLVDLVCTSCGRAYPEANGVPILVAEAANPVAP